MSCSANMCRLLSTMPHMIPSPYVISLISGLNLVILSSLPGIMMICYMVCSLKFNQGSRKLAPLAPPVPDKPYLVGQNEILMEKYWTYYGRSEEILSYSDMIIGHIVQ